jgi:O-antigen ligase
MGVGFDAWHPLTFALYAPNPQDVHAAHSIYFSVLADHGWIGLLLFLLLFGLSWKTLQGLAGTLRQQPEQQTLYVLVPALKVSFIAYFVGGAFLSLSYFDLPWQLISVVLIVQRLQTRPQPQAEAASSPTFGRFATVPRHER